MAILSFRVSTYARNVYLYGNTKLTDIATTPDNYRAATMEYAASHYDIATLNEALASGFITQQEYDETIALIK